MPISVACRCGKAFAANDNLAGKTVKCPACQQPLTIPLPGQQGAAAARPQTGAQPAPQQTADGKIVVACACGAKFAAGAELAGKRVKCPKCGNALTVGAAQGAVTPSSQATAGGAAAIPVASPATPAFGGDFGLAGLLDEAGVKQKATGENACPSCGEFMAPEALLCIHCGYNRKTGKKLTTEKIKKVEAKKLGAPTAAAKAGAAKSAASAGALNPYASPGSAAPARSAEAQLTVMDYLFVIFCGGIALIVAIIYIIQGNPKGMPLLKAWAVVTAIAFVINVGLTLMMIAMQGAGN
jgi:hypothetical protein